MKYFRTSYWACAESEFTQRMDDIRPLTSSHSLSVKIPGFDVLLEQKFIPSSKVAQLELSAELKLSATLA